MSQNICLLVKGRPLISVPFSQSRGVQQYSSQLMYIEYCRKSSSLSSIELLPVTSKKPCSPLFWVQVISQLRILLIRQQEVAADIKNCFFGSGSNLLGFPRDFCHFQPKLVSWSAAAMNCSGERVPFPSKSFSEGVNFEFRKLLIDPIIIILKVYWMLKEKIEGSTPKKVIRRTHNRNKSLQSFGVHAIMSPEYDLKLPRSHLEQQFPKTQIRILDLDSLYLAEKEYSLKKSTSVMLNAESNLNLHFGNSKAIKEKMKHDYNILNFWPTQA